MSTQARFPAASRLLHWLMAAMIIAMFFIGVGMAASLSPRASRSDFSTADFACARVTARTNPAIPIAAGPHQARKNVTVAGLFGSPAIDGK